jgi:Rrf2 family iron-sulfur cluster assembly transcriptional regulator
MRLFKSSEYAIRCLVYMAVHRDEVCSVKTLSESLDIPYKFLGRLMSSLGRAGIVDGLHGKNGGYVIARPLEDLHLADIIDVVEGLDSYDRCILGFDQCDDENPCPMHDRWKDQKDAIREMIDNTTLADLSRGEIHRL